MSKEKIKEFLRPDLKKILIWISLVFFVFFFFYSIQYNILYYDLHEPYPEKLPGHLPFVITLLILSLATTYPISCLLAKESEKFKFLKPNFFKIKFIIFLILYYLLASMLRRISFSLPSGFEIGGIWYTLEGFVVFIFLPFTFYFCISYLQSSSLVHKILRLNWLKFIFSIFLCLILSHFLYRAECNGTVLAWGCEYYYFPFYTHFRTDVIVPLSSSKLLINFILGCILVFPISIFLSFFTFEKTKNFKKFINSLNFITPTWNKILVLLIIMFILSKINFPLCFTSAASFGFDGNILLILGYGLLWYLLSCLIIFAYNKFRRH